MNKYNAYKYVVDINDSIPSLLLLELFSAPRESGILNVKVVQGKSRIIVYALDNSLSFSKYGKLVGGIETLVYYELFEYDDFEATLKNELYDTNKELCLHSWIESY